ncbi:hypothetical protein L6R29_24920 [Myxococcota bacterium]|nr:hypothetical protein [Myxococcota bacterium]
MIRTFVACVLLCLCVSVASPAYAIPPLLPLLCRPCTQSTSCGQGQLCWGSKTGMGTCLQACSSEGSCFPGFRCATLAAGLKYCLPEKNCDMTCNQTSECPTGYACTENRCLRSNGGQEGDLCDAKAPCSANLTCASDEGASRCVSLCSPQTTPPPCAAGFRCRPFEATRYGCFREIGSQKSGERCSLFLPCEAGSECRKSSSDVPALCYKSCRFPNPDTTTCKGLGTCDFIGRTGNYCFCEKDADCDNKKQCILIQGPFQRGLCQAGDQTTCTTDADCIEDTTCVQGRCAFPSTTEPAPELTAETIQESTPEPTSSEPTQEPSTDQATTEPNREPLADQATTDSSDGPTPEIPTEIRVGTDVSIDRGACHCQSADPLPLGLGLGLIGLWLLFRRRRSNAPPSAL